MSEPIQYDRRRFIQTTAMTIAGAGLLGSRWREPEPGSVGYAEAGPSDGPVIILLQGQSDDIKSHVNATALATKGYRVIAPYLASDVIALMDGLKIDKALVGSLDRASRTAVVIAERWPQRVKAIAQVSGFNLISLDASQRPLPPHAELGWWYRYYFVRARVSVT